MKKTSVCAVLVLLAALLWGCASMDLYRSRQLPQELACGPGVFITWLGTAGVLVSDGKTGILIDPFVSRPGLARVAFSLPLHPDYGLVREWAGRLGQGQARAVIVSHSHYDHVLDAPFFALETGSVLHGSESTLNVARGAGMPEGQLRLVTSGEAFAVGDFTVTLIEGRHGPVLFGRIPYPGTIDEPLAPPRPARDYRLGTTYAILIRHPAGTILHHGSTGFVPGMYDGMQADVVLLGIAGWKNTPGFLEEVPQKVGARMVIPIHFDDFFKPLDHELSFLYNSHFGEFCDRAAASNLPVGTAAIGKGIRVLPLK